MRKDFIYEVLKKNLKATRIKHVEGVRKTARELALFNGVDSKKADFAALCHDMYRVGQEKSDQYIKELGLPEKYIGNRNLAHSKIAEAKLREEFDITDQDILNAVSYHTTGRKNMSKLEKIIFIADAVEPGRNYKGVEILRNTAYVDLDMACLQSLYETVDRIKNIGAYLDGDTLEAIKYFEKIIEEREII